MKKTKALRFLKYAVVAPAISVVMRNSSLLDGRDEEPIDAINFAGAGDFKKIGDAQVELLVSRADFSSQDRVLDVGCGLGRVALAIQRRFPEIEYVGFDIVRYGIDWVGKKLGGSSNFSFHHADVMNSFYNPRGKMHPEQFRFPVVSSSQDLVFATSVFTHLLEPAARHYLHEIARCLDEGVERILQPSSPIKTSVIGLVSIFRATLDWRLSPRETSPRWRSDIRLLAGKKWLPRAISSSRRFSRANGEMMGKERIFRMRSY